MAGPIGKNDAGRPGRIANAVKAGRQLLAVGIAPFVPHLWAAACDDADALLSYEDWLSHGFSWIERCDAVFRIPGESPGADREVAFAEAHHLRVFYSVAGIIAWRDLGAPELPGRLFERWGS